MGLPPAAKVFTYVVETPIMPSYDFPIKQILVDTILAGCMEHSVDEDFCAEWYIALAVGRIRMATDVGSTTG